ncbi:uncharacterized protein LOC144102158 [Amblyomma americanum]
MLCPTCNSHYSQTGSFEHACDPLVDNPSCALWFRRVLDCPASRGVSGSSQARDAFLMASHTSHQRQPCLAVLLGSQCWALIGHSALSFALKLEFLWSAQTLSRQWMRIRAEHLLRAQGSWHAGGEQGPSVAWMSPSMERNSLRLFHRPEPAACSCLTSASHCGLHDGPTPWRATVTVGARCGCCAWTVIITWAPLTSGCCTAPIHCPRHLEKRAKARGAVV